MITLYPQGGSKKQQVSKGKTKVSPGGGENRGEFPPDLQKVIDSWQKLSDAQRAAIVRMVES